MITIKQIHKRHPTEAHSYPSRYNDKEGLEGNNKLLRAIRIKLSRKTSQVDNLEDTLNRMWIQSDPVVNIERRKVQPYCKYCEIKGHSTRYCSKKHMACRVLEEEDSVVESLFLIS